MLAKDRIAEITQKLYERRQFAYIRVDINWCVLEVSSNLNEFGFASMEIGVDATEEIDFLVGIKIDANLDLPMISSPTEKPIRATLIPSNKSLTIVIMDALDEFHQQKQLQQKANENQLLLDTQVKLLLEIKTAKQQLEYKNEQLQEAARLQASFLSGVSHEFRTPLTSIIGYTNLLLDEANSGVEESNKKINYLAAVKRSSKHLLSLIENLLDHGKFQSKDLNLYPKATNLVELFNDVFVLVKPLAATKQLKFELNLSIPETSEVVIDDSRLRQCLINIIGNAIKFTESGEVIVSAKYLDERLAVEVKDTGIGIKGEYLNKIKQPYWQAPDTGVSGTGLGLTITERIIEMMGGSLQIESTLGDGSLVKFDIIAPINELEIISGDVVESYPKKNMSILLAEDDEDIATLVKLMLETRGMQVCLVQNGALAVDKLNDQAFDLVLMDLHMPVLDGYSAVKCIRESGNQVPIVIMTASSMEADRSKAEELGCDAYLIKPVDMSDLISIANQLVN